MPEKNSRLRQAQEEAEEVKVIMMDNMKKTEERKEKLQDLDKRAEELKLKSKSFHKTSMKVKEQKKCDNIKAKWKLIAVVAALAIIVILVTIFMLVNRSNPENTHDKGSTTMHEGGITPTTIGPGK
uniref:V-SNARE coiled-coil homology domain-containing protein n=1 Tax=Hucho hucho TaxID=62062 RepID=A0A4W5KSU9_9TELE